MPRPDELDPMLSLNAANDSRVSKRIGSGTFAQALWKERALMAGVALGVFTLGAAFTLTMKTQYPTTSSVLVRLGDEYVYQPTVGDAGKGAVPSTPEQLIQSEIEILSSAALKERVLTKLGIDRLSPELGAEYKKASGATEQDRFTRRKVMGEAVHLLGQGLKVSPAPNTPVIRLIYKHEDPQFAADALNRIIDEYLAYRREVLQGVTAPLIAAQRKRFEDRLGDAQTELEAFLTQNKIGDFEGEQKANVDLYAQVYDEYYRVQAQRRQVEARRDSLARKLGQVAPQVSLYVDDSSRDKLLALKMERSDLAARYTSDAPQVKVLDDRIAQLEKFLSTGGAEGQGPRRTGVNPVHQALEADQLQADAEAVSLREREAALSRQLSELSERQLWLQSLAPRYQQLLRESTVLESNAKAFAEREEETRASHEISEQVTDNIRIIERPVAAVKGTSMRLPVLVLSAILGVLTGLLVGAMRVLARMPVVAPAVRTGRSHIGDLPVLAVLPLKVTHR